MAMCSKDLCYDGEARRIIGDECCACPEDHCALARCSADLCGDGEHRRLIGDDCCGCPEESCATVMCGRELCWDGGGPRPIGSDCCACPDFEPLVDVVVAGIGADCNGITPSDANEIDEKAALRTWIPDFNLKRSTENNPLVFGSFQTGNNWGAVFSSLLNVNTAGEYTFYLELGRADTAEVLLSARTLGEAIQTPLDRKPLLDKLREQNLPSELSADPGRYLCNASFFHALHLNEMESLGCPAVFVHLPQLGNPFGKNLKKTLI